MPILFDSYTQHGLPIISAIIAKPGTVFGNPKLPTFRALLDTGATGSCISPNVVARLGLQPAGKANVAGVGGSNSHNTFLIDLLIPMGTMAQHEKGKLVTEVAIGATFDVILGMDIISRGQLVVTFDGRFTFAL